MSYDNYYEKHCARYYGWLPAIKEFKAQKRNKSIKYFTLCAEEAIDVFMLEMENVIERDEKNKLHNIIICEKQKDIAATILQLVKPPYPEAIIIGPLEQILTFQDDHHTEGIDPNEAEDVPSRHIRQKLRFKGLHQKLKQSFPFDIINFDTYGNMLNHEKESNRRLYEALEQIFKLQGSINQFILLITVPIFDIHPEIETEFRQSIMENADNYSEIRECMTKILQTIDYEQIEVLKKISLGFAKSTIHQMAHNNRWKCNHKGIYIYESQNKNLMMSSVIECVQATQELFDRSEYIDDVTNIISNMPNFYPFEEEKDSDVKAHLDSVVEFRENNRKLL